MNPNTMMLQIDIIGSQRRGFIHPEAVVIDHAKQGPIADRVDGIKESADFILGEIFGEGAHDVES
jgi:hypothetical protein